MDNPLISHLKQLFDVASDRVSKSKGKKILGLFTEMPAHERLFFGHSGEYASAAAYRVSESSYIIYAIKHESVSSEAICYHGIWKGGEDIEWYVSKINEGTLEVRQDIESSMRIDKELMPHLSQDAIVANIYENDSRAGYFIPVYPQN